MRLTSVWVSALFLTLLVTASLPAQSRRRADRPADPRGPARAGIAGQPGDPTTGGLDGPGGPALKPSRLEDATLNPADQRRYDALILNLSKQAGGPVRANQQPNPLQEIDADFRTGSAHLRFGQETLALESFTKAWTGMLELLKDAKSAAAANVQARTHLSELQKLAGDDPELVLALMTELAPQHQAAFEAIEQPKLQAQLAMPLAATWARLVQAGRLDKASLALAANWLLMYPQLVTADRPLNPDQRSEIEAQLTRIEVDFSNRARQMAERQRAQAMGIRGNPVPVTPNAEGQNADPALQESMANFEAKRGPMIEFMKADILLRFGQFRAGLTASAAGWRKLMDFYHANPRSMTPADTEMHFETLGQIQAANPIQALVMVDELDPMYRGMLMMDPRFGTKVADAWSRLATDLPLNTVTLSRALFWVEHAGQAGTEGATRYATELTVLKKKFADARAKEEGEKNGDTEINEDKPRRENKPKKGVEKEN